MRPDNAWDEESDEGSRGMDRSSRFRRLRFVAHVDLHPTRYVPCSAHTATLRRVGHRVASGILLASGCLIGDTKRAQVRFGFISGIFIPSDASGLTVICFPFTESTRSFARNSTCQTSASSIIVAGSGHISDFIEQSLSNTCFAVSPTLAISLGVAWDAGSSETVNSG